MSELYYWVAINGASAAVSSLPMPITVEVSPRPEGLIGYRTKEEQLERQKFFLTAPIKEVNDYMKFELGKEVARNEVVVIQPEKPERPTKGATFWFSGPMATAPVERIKRPDLSKKKKK
jgi:hypothetical protein